MKKIFSLMLLNILFIPITVYASEYLIASGRTIGVELKSDSVLVVGSYKIHDNDVFSNSSLKIGDKIIQVDDNKVTSTKELQDVINKIDGNKVKVTYLRNNQKYETEVDLYLDDGIYKTGLYVRDSIRGVATLTYINPSDKTFGALGHEIVEKSSKSKFEADNGTIFSSIVTGITKSSNGSPGEKNARSNSSDVIGKVLENTNSGVFGIYTDTLPNSKLYKVANDNDVKPGAAEILTVVNGNKIEKFSINILKLNNNSKTKNILFEVTDKNLLDKTGGIIQGMSGSPIIQGDYIVGAVNYVLVDSPKKGYGISISNMLREAKN